MKMTIYEALEMIDRGETPEEYEKRVKKIRKYSKEKDDLEDAIEVLGDDPRVIKRKKRLAKVNELLEKLM